MVPGIIEDDKDDYARHGKESEHGFAPEHVDEEATSDRIQRSCDHPTMGSGYAALHTVQRISLRRPGLKLAWWRGPERIRTKMEKQENVRWDRTLCSGKSRTTLVEGLLIQRMDSSWMHLLMRASSATWYERTNDASMVMRSNGKKTCYDEVRNVGLDYSATVKHLRSKVGCKKKETWVHPKERHDGSAARIRNKHKFTAEERGAQRSVMCNSAETMETLTKIRPIL